MTKPVSRELGVCDTHPGHAGRHFKGGTCLNWRELPAEAHPAGPPLELHQAIHIANRILDRPYADPDDDIAILARQFLRSVERVAATAPVPETREKLEAENAVLREALREARTELMKIAADVVNRRYLPDLEKCRTIHDARGAVARYDGLHATLAERIRVVAERLLGEEGKL